MTSSKFAAASVIALATLAAGSAFAADNLPMAGEAPFATPTTSVSGESRAAVRAQARQGVLPAAGEFSQIAAPAVSDEHPTRAEVRSQARQNFKPGQFPRSGEMS